MAENLSSVDLVGLQKTAQSQLEAVEQGRSHLNLAVTHAQTLASTWQGEASQHYQTALANFNEHGQKLLGTLSNMHQMMLDTHGQFNAANQTALDNARTASQAVSVDASTPAIPAIPVSPMSPRIPMGPVTPGLPGL